MIVQGYEVRGGEERRRGKREEESIGEQTRQETRATGRENRETYR